MKLWQIGLVSVAAAVALPAVAQMNWDPQTRSGVEARVKERLGKFDSNKDGTVSSEEMKSYADARMKARNDDHFAAMDTDKNGAISRTEFDAQHARGHGKGERIVRIERMRLPGGASPPMPPTHEGAMKMERGKHLRMMMRDRDDVTVMADGDGRGIVIADAVKRALERFDATDANKDGTISAEERKAAREAWRVKMRTMTAPQPPKVG